MGHLNWRRKHGTLHIHRQCYTATIRRENRKVFISFFISIDDLELKHVCPRFIAQLMTTFQQELTGILLTYLNLGA
jgi:hypothetical protein